MGATALLGNMLVSASVIESAATAVLTTSATMSASVASRMANGLVWLLLGTVPMRSTPPGDVHFGMTLVRGERTDRNGARVLKALAPPPLLICRSRTCYM